MADQSADPTPTKPTPPRSPASKRIQVWVAVAFLVVWLVAHMYDFFIAPTDVVPLWFTAAGLLVLGFLLGISGPEMTSTLGPGIKK